MALDISDFFKRPLKAPAAVDLDEVERRLNDSLAARLSKATNYTAREVDDAASQDFNLFPHGSRLGKQTAEDFRFLSNFSQTKLRPASQITSHRKFIGRFIVAFKKFIYPFIAIHLKQPFAGLYEFNNRTVRVLAQHETDIQLLHDEISSLRREVSRLSARSRN